MERNDKKYTQHLKLAGPSILFSYLLLVLLVLFGNEKDKYYYSLALIILASPVLVNGTYILHFGYCARKSIGFNIFTKSKKGYIVKGKRARFIGNLYILLFCVVSIYALVALAK